MTPWPLLVCKFSNLPVYDKQNTPVPPSFPLTSAGQGVQRLGGERGVAAAHAPDSEARSGPPEAS